MRLASVQSSPIWSFPHTIIAEIRYNAGKWELCPRHDVVTISSISYRYRLFYVDIVHTFLLSILRRHRFDIVTISSCNCLINCIAVDIDTISIRYRFMIVGLAVLLSISSISIRYRHVPVVSTVLLSISSISSISIRYRHVLVGSTVLLSISSISIRYRHDIVS